MKIRAVHTAVVQANFDYVLVRVDTEDGVMGFGECFHAPGLSAIVRELGDVLVGQDARNVEPLRARLLAAASNSGGNAPGISNNAISGIETALWDLNGRALGAPVVQLLGGAFRDKVAVYADLHAGGELESLDAVARYRTPFWKSESGETEPGQLYWEASEAEVNETELVIARAREAVAAGYEKLKFDLDIFSTERETTNRSMSPRELDEMAERAMRLRQAVGRDVEIAFDCHWRFDVPTARRVAAAIAPAEPMWLEDPVPPDPRALATVARDSPVPIATGENNFLVETFAELVAQGSVHILTPDCQKVGGLLESVRIAELGARSFLPIAPHCIAGPLGFIASAHVCAAASTFMSLEFHGSDVPFWSQLVKAERPIIEGGYAAVPTGPGLGVELDMETVTAYSAPGEPVFDAPPAR